MPTKIFQNKKSDSIGKLKNHLELMKKELDDTHKQISTLKKSNKISDWEKIDYINGKSINDLKQYEDKLTKEINATKREIKSRSKILLLTEVSILPVVFLLLIISGVGPDLLNNTLQENNSFKSRYFVENLRGDTLDTWKSWRLIGTTMNVNIIAPSNIPPEKVEIVKNAITSMEAIEIEDSLTHKGPKGSYSKYYFGWRGALNDIKEDIVSTEYQFPLDFNVMGSNGGEGDIVITLSSLRDVDGYSGYTKSIVEGNEILKSFITIYDTGNLDEEELSTITRHEFGHALGLGHSTAPEDLMAPTIDMTYPYISECNVAALVELYNGGQDTQVVCEK